MLGTPKAKPTNGDPLRNGSTLIRFILIGIKYCASSSTMRRRLRTSQLLQVPRPLLRTPRISHNTTALGLDIQSICSRGEVKSVKYISTAVNMPTEAGSWERARSTRRHTLGKWHTEFHLALKLQMIACNKCNTESRGRKKKKNY
jgi:hypothetical protein